MSVPLRMCELSQITDVRCRRKFTVIMQTVYHVNHNRSHRYVDYESLKIKNKVTPTAMYFNTQ